MGEEDGFGVLHHPGYRPDPVRVAWPNDNFFREVTGTDRISPNRPRGLLFFPCF